ncbi:MAG TPA: ABC transporter permease, partial [Methylovirgula sp.]
MNRLSNIFWLGTKELRSFFSDVVLLGLVIYTFSFAIYVQGHSNAQELYNGSVAYVDDDKSELSRRMMAVFLPPY